MSHTSRRPATSAGLFRGRFRQRLPFLPVPAGVAGNGHNSAPSRFVVAVTCGTRAAAGSARVADASLGQLAQEGSRRLWPASAPPAVGTTSGRRRCRVEAARHPRRKAAPCTKCAAELHTFGPLCRLTFVFAPPNGSSAARPAAALAASACCDVVGSPIPPTPVCFTHTEPTPQTKGRQQLDRWRDRRLLRVGTSRSPSQRAGRHGCRQRRPARRLGSLVLCVAPIEADDGPPSRGAGRFVRPCAGPAGMAAPTPSGSPHRLTFGAGSIERTPRSMSRMGSTGKLTRHVCRHGFANGVSRAPSARFWCGGVNAKHPHDVTCAGADCRERRCLFCLRGPAACLRGCRKSILRRRPLPASAAVRAVRLLPAANAFRPAHRLPRTLEVVGHG